MKFINLEPHVAVAGQIAPTDVPAIAAAGFRVLVNNRPDGEAPGQPLSEDLKAVATAAGLEYHYLPVNAANFPGPDTARLTDVFTEVARPVLAFCRTGTRCANLWVVTRETVEQGPAAERARALGFDLAMATRYLESGV